MQTAPDRKAGAVVLTGQAHQKASLALHQRGFAIADNIHLPPLLLSFPKSGVAI
jgi:hypothetical protein